MNFCDLNEDFNSQIYFQLNYFVIQKDLFKFTALNSIWLIYDFCHEWKISTLYNLEALKKNSYLPQYKWKDIRSQIAIKIWSALVEIQSQNRLVNKDHKGDTGKPEGSSGIGVFFVVFSW